MNRLLILIIYVYLSGMYLGVTLKMVQIDVCLKEIGLCVQNIIIVLDLTIKTTGGTYITT